MTMSQIDTDRPAGGHAAAVPAVAPHRIADDTYLIPNLAPARADAFLSVNRMVIRGEQPIVVDTGAPIHRDRWFEQVFSLVDPEDVRYVYLSHDDGDHTGNLHEILERAPQATLVVNFFITERLALEKALPLERMVWLGPGEHLDAGDRRLRLVVPPIFDGPTTRRCSTSAPACCGPWTRSPPSPPVRCTSATTCPPTCATRRPPC